MQEAELRRQSLEKRDKERLRYLSEQRQKQQRDNELKRQMREKKIQIARNLA